MCNKLVYLLKAVVALINNSVIICLTVKKHKNWDNMEVEM